MSSPASTVQSFNVLSGYASAKNNNIPEVYYRDIFQSIENSSVQFRDQMTKILKEKSAYLYVVRQKEKDDFRFQGALIGSMEMPTSFDRMSEDVVPPRLPTGFKFPRDIPELVTYNMHGFIPPVDSLVVSREARIAMLAVLKSRCLDKKIAFAHAFIKENDVDPVVSEEDDFLKIPVYPHAPDESDYFCVYPKVQWNEYWKRKST